MSIYLLEVTEEDVTEPEDKINRSFLSEEQEEKRFKELNRMSSLYLVRVKRSEILNK